MTSSVIGLKSFFDTNAKGPALVTAFDDDKDCLGRSITAIACQTSEKEYTLGYAYASPKWKGLNILC